MERLDWRDVDLLLVHESLWIVLEDTKSLIFELTCLLLVTALAFLDRWHIWNQIAILMLVACQCHFAILFIP